MGYIGVCRATFQNNSDFYEPQSLCNPYKPIVELYEAPKPTLVYLKNSRDEGTVQDGGFQN